MKEMVWIDFVIVGIYMLSMIIIGIIAGRMNKSEDDYFKGGSKVPWVMSSLSFFIGSFSAYMFVAASSLAYKTGFSCLLLFTSGAWACFFAMFFLVKYFRRSRIMSPMELIVMRYGETTRTFFTIIRVPAYVLIIANCLYVLCIFVSSALGLTGTYRVLGMDFNGLQLCLAVTGLIAVVYTTIGGLWAVIITSTVQFAIVMVVTIVILPFCFIELSPDSSILNGISTFVSNPPTEDYFHLITPSQTFFFSACYIALVLITYAGEFSLIQRSVCVVDEKAAKKSMALSAILSLFAPVLWIAPVFVMRSKLPDMANLWPTLINPQDGTYVTISRMILPNGMIGLTVAAIFAATMSTASTFYNILAAIFTQDIYKSHIYKQATNKHLLLVGKLATFGFGMLSIVVAFLLSTFKDAFETSLLIFSHFGIVLACPVAISVMIRRIPKWTALLAMPMCLLSTLFVEFVIPKLADGSTSSILQHVASHAFEYKVIAAILANTLAIGIASIFYQYDSEKEKDVDRLFALLNTPVRDSSDKKLYIPNLASYRLVGWTLLIFGICLVPLTFIPGITDERHINLVAAGLMIASFIAIQWLTSPKFSPITLVRLQQKDADRLTEKVS